VGQIISANTIIIYDVCCYFTDLVERRKYVQRASEVLQGAAARMSRSEHPLQWEEIQEQLAKCG
jgi:hypothetical protein